MISGLQKMTLLDYPGKVACTVFLQGCNFRCPFCHNSDLLGKDGPETIEVDTPCSSIDIVPTLLNLFGIEYDSRLYSGRDIFATNYVADQVSTCMPLVVVPNTGGTSWITAAGTYEASSKTFTPNPGIEVDEDYVRTVKTLVEAKLTYAKYIVQQDYYEKIFD